jgi:hypothetical protein
VYLEHDDLVLTNDMTLSSDGKLYLTQAPIYEGWYSTFPPKDPDEFNPHEGRLMRPARVISIDKDKNLNVEFELPSHQTPGNLAIRPIAGNKLYPGYQSYWPGERIKLVEDEENFYVSDLLEKMVYRLSKQSRRVSTLHELPEHPPIALLKDNGGNLYVISAPIIREDLSIFRNPKLIRISGSNIQEMYEFDLGDFQFQNFFMVKEDVVVDGKQRYYPTFYDISAVFTGEVNKSDSNSPNLMYTDSDRRQVRRAAIPSRLR